ncbi:MAG: fused response regulator/phosphatase [bacterium]|nr:fused response regulator/phosphatase [bacterium]
MNNPGNSSTDARAQLLVVDDNEMNRDMLSRRLQRKGYEVTCAEDGQRALDLIGERSFDLVLLDIMMPGIDGNEVLVEVREHHAAADLPIIMATAKDDTGDIVNSLKLGANDYVTKPLDFPVVMARVQTQLALKEANDALRSAHERMKRDLDAAAEVQQAMMPQAPPIATGYSFGWEYQPCDELAGDTMNLIRFDDRHLGIYVVDVSGHGVPAALLAMSVTHSLSHRGDDSATVDAAIVPPVTVVDRLNDHFQMSRQAGRYFTLTYGVLDHAQHVFRYVTAGHPGPIVLRRGEPAESIESPSFPVGIVPAGDYEESTASLEPGDRLYLFSDGLIEEFNADSEQFGSERLRAAIDAGRDLELGDSLRQIVQALREWCAGSQFSDDVTILGMERAE